MGVIRGTSSPKRRRRWWAPRPDLRLVPEPRPSQTREDPFVLAMIGSFCVFVLAFAMFIGAWSGSSFR